MSQNAPLTRQEHLLKFESFCRALDGAVQKTGLSPEETSAAIRSSVSAQCVACAIPISGEELLALLQPPPAENPNPKVERLRRGDCARKGCDSFYYRVSFQNHPKLDWPKVLEQAEHGLSEPEAEKSTATNSKGLLGLMWSSGVALRLGIALAGIILALVLRQWYFGGRIWLIREPEHFKVDPIAASDQETSGEAAER